MTLCLGLVVLGAVVAGVTSQCPPLPDTDGVTTVTVEWQYDMWNDQCQANRRGSDQFTRFTRGQRKSIDDLDLPCLIFLCDNKTKTLRLDTSASSCAYKSRCTKGTKFPGACQERYKCLNAVYDEAQSYTYDKWYQYRESWFSVFTGFTCGHTGSGPCDAGQCFNPFADPKQVSLATGSTCVATGGRVVSDDNQAHECQRLESVCTDRPRSYFVDLVASELVCDVNGTFVSAGTVTWSDACSQTVCNVSTGVGELTTSFKDKPGCVHGDECIAQGDKVDGRTEYTCAQFTCRRNLTLDSPYYFYIKDKGCLLSDMCYTEGQRAPTTDDPCRRMYCRKDELGHFHWEQEMRGCYDPGNGQCRPDEFQYTLDECVVNTCVARQFGRWKTYYKKSRSCAPQDGKCTRKNGAPGCKHKGRCYAVKSVLTMNACLQYVCYSEDEELNTGGYSHGSPDPVWEARATGCFGPGGCMPLGQQNMDPITFNTYRCDYRLGGFGMKRPEFHKACNAPNGELLALGKSVLIGTVWYSCYKRGVIRNPIDRSLVFVPKDHNHTCGDNPDTGNPLYKAEYYFTPEGRCKRVGYHCDLDCQYFDQPCTHTDLTPYRYIGDTFLLDDAQCVCTQDYEINNKKIPNTSSIFNTPSLCGEVSVRGAACVDPDDGSLHQWGELWEQSRGNQICTCHPLLRRAFCSRYLPDVTDALENMQI